MTETVDYALAEVAKLKIRATGLRNRKELDQALAVLSEAVNYLEGCLVRIQGEEARSRSERAKVRIELADTLGMMGGVCRRQDNFSMALEFYEKGLTYESEDRVSTYNLGNTISLSIVVQRRDPQQEPLASRIATVLEELRTKTSGTDASRIDEWWAWADLGQLYLLSGRPDEARDSFSSGLNTNPPSDEVRRTLLLLRQLADSLPSSADSIARFIKAQASDLEAYV
jgi:tetratricopeptide (TPR) repeat protein